MTEFHCVIQKPRKTIFKKLATIKILEGTIKAGDSGVIMNESGQLTEVTFNKFIKDNYSTNTVSKGMKCLAELKGISKKELKKGIHIYKIRNNEERELNL